MLTPVIFALVFRTAPLRILRSPLTNAQYHTAHLEFLKEKVSTFASTTRRTRSSRSEDKNADSVY